MIAAHASRPAIARAGSGCSTVIAVDLSDPPWDAG